MEDKKEDHKNYINDESVKQKHEQDRKVNQFRENNAAKKIQRHWTKHQYEKHEHEREEASSLIRAALMGHTTRRKQIKDYHDDDEDDYETDNEEYNECSYGSHRGTSSYIGEDDDDF
ncbi:hypothetical protein MAR_028466 [Mya arenaria]|uniref:Uncharacterized protein n=1 Tax=Mya arenaria TaxID=6604 RepID=A0ABY7DDP5_MYAAR|nr:hypothetical protein MAR_028466 [Mya arenaria]